MNVCCNKCVLYGDMGLCVCDSGVGVHICSVRYMIGYDVIM